VPVDDATAGNEETVGVVVAVESPVESGRLELAAALAASGFHISEAVTSR